MGEGESRQFCANFPTLNCIWRNKMEFIFNVGDFKPNLCLAIEAAPAFPQEITRELNFVNLLLTFSLILYLDNRPLERKK
jgi:hypothetical protein